MGFATSVLGAFKHELATSLRIDNARIGGLVSTVTFTSMVMSLFLGVMIDMTGYLTVALTGFLITSISFYLLVTSRSYKSSVFACVLLGVGGMSLNAFGSTLVTVTLFSGENPSLALTIGHMFGSFGAMTPPLVMGFFLAHLGFRRIGYILALVLLVPLPMVLFAGYPAVSADFELMQSFRLLSNPAVLAACTALYYYVGTEASFGTWITSYASHLNVSKRTSQFALTLFWLSLMLGRLFSSKLISLANEMPLIIILASVAAVTTTVMIFNRNGSIGIVATIISGLTLGPIFPILVGRIFAAIDVSLRGSVYGILVASGLYGASTIPALVGIYSRKRPFGKNLVIVLGTNVVLIFMIAVVSRLTS